MNGTARLITLLAASLLAATAHARILWRSGASLADWDEKQSAATPGRSYSPDRLAVVTSPVAGGPAHVIRVCLKAGDRAFNPRHFPPVPLGNRSELIHLPRVGEGDERWYRWQVLFPTGFSVTDGKGGGAVFAQWHHWSLTGEPGSPPLLLTADARWIKALIVPSLRSQDVITLTRVAQRPGHWRAIVLHIVFSSDPSKGLFEMWCDGKRAASTHVATLFPGYEAYLKMGLYRRPTAREDNVIYFGDVVEATRHGDVWPLHQ